MSFTDMMSSGRGPGVIGMLMALFVLIGFGVLFMFAFDEGMQGADQSIESVISRQATEIQDAQQRISRASDQLARAPELTAVKTELAQVKRENVYREGRIDGLEKGVESTNEALSQKNAEFDGYKDKYRELVRGRAKGREMDRIVTADGTAYDKVTIREVTAVGIAVMHTGGLKRIPYEDLPAEMQEEFQFDAKQKADAIARENELRTRHESAVSVASDNASQKAAERKRKEEEAAAERNEQALVVIQSRIKSLEEEIRARETAIRIETTKTISRAPQMKAQLASKQQELSALRARYARMAGAN